MNLIPLSAAGVAILVIVLLGLFCASVKAIDATVKAVRRYRQRRAGA